MDKIFMPLHIAVRRLFSAKMHISSLDINRLEVNIIGIKMDFTLLLLQSADEVAETGNFQMTVLWCHKTNLFTCISPFRLHRVSPNRLLWSSAPYCPLNPLQCRAANWKRSFSYIAYKNPHKRDWIKIWIRRKHRIGALSLMIGQNNKIYVGLHLSSSEPPVTPFYCDWSLCEKPCDCLRLLPC